MSRKRTRIWVSVVQSLVFLILALVILYFGLHTLEGLLPIIIIVIIALAGIFIFQKSKLFK